MIRCRHCGGKARTLETRMKGDGIERRRECTKCGRRFMTVEVWERDIRSIKNVIANRRDNGKYKQED